MASNDTYNTSKRDRHRAAASLLAFKFGQEDKLKNALRPHFRQVSAQVKNSYANTGRLPSFDAHRDAVKQILNDHYIDTASQASTTLRDNFKPISNNDRVQALIDANIDIDADDRSDFAADSIADTTKDDFNQYIKEAIAGAAVIGISLSRNDIADLASDDFDNSIDDRIDLISQMETGIAADDGKYDEIEALQDTDEDFDDGTNLSDYNIKKTWTAILDDRTRPAHAEADGQTVNYDEPYIVDGEELPEPRDDSLGASASNIMGCRCESIESLQ